MNYVSARSARNIIPILWIKLEEDLILRFPTLTREAETWSPIWSPYFKITKRRVVPKNYLATLETNKINTNKILWKYSAVSLKLNQCCHELIFDHSFHTMLNKRNKINWKWLIAMVVGGWAVLDLPPILFIKLELYCGRFVDLILCFPRLTRSSQRGVQSFIFCSKRFIDPMLTQKAFPEIFILLQQYSYYKIFARYFY